MRFMLLLCMCMLPGLGFAKSEMRVSGATERLKSSYQNDKSKKSNFSKFVAKKINTRRKSSQRILGYIGNIAVGSTRVGEDIGKAATDSALYNFGGCSFSGPGVSVMTVLHDGCSGKSFVGGCVIDIKIEPTTAGEDSVVASCPWTRVDEEGTTYGAMVNPGSWTAVTVLEPPRCPMTKKGSIIHVDSRSLGEYIPLVGVSFGLYYTTEIANGYLAVSEGVRDYMWRATGFTPTIQHIYDAPHNKLYRGDGSPVPAVHVTLSGGNVRVVSSDGSEVYEFDSSGKHLNTKYALTGTTKYTFAYETLDNQLKSIVDAFGNTTTFNKDSSGNLISITAPNGQVTTLETHIDTYMMTKLTNPNGEFYQFEYDPDREEFLTKFTKPGGQESTFTYDDDGRLVKDLGAGGNYTQLSGDLTNNPLELIQRTAMGIETYHEVEQDVNGNYIRNGTEPSGLETQYIETPNGGVTMASPSMSVAEARANDVRLGSLYQRLDSRSYTYGSSAGLTTNITQSISPATPTNIFTFTSLTTNANHGGLTTTEVYTTSNKTFTTTTPQGVVSTRTINAKEQTTGMKLGSDVAWSFTYDTKGRLSESKQNTKNKNIYAYNTAGFLQSITNPWSGVTSFGYDLAGRRTSMTLPDSRVVNYGYDANGNLTGVTPPGKPQHEFMLNLMELAKKYLPPALSGLLNKDTEYSYNLDKQITDIDRPDGESVAYNYSATTGLLTSIVQSIAGTDSYTYDTEGRISQIDSADGIRTTITYDGPFLKKEKQTLISDSSQLGYVEYGLDSRFRTGTRDVVVRSEPTYQSDYSYNNDDQKTADESISYTYSGTSGRLATSTLGNVTDSWTYDTYGYLTGYTAKYSGTTIYSYTLTRDVGSRISGRSETIGGVTTAYVYTYDTAGRLKTVTKGGAAYSSYNYDSNSNRTSGVTAGTAFTATYDDQDRILTYNTNTYGYNANGELTSKQVGTATPTTFEYNQFGNLKKVTLPTSSVIQYSLDGHQRRSIRQVGTSPREFYTHEGPLKVVGSLTEGSSASLKIFIFGTDGNSPEYIRYQGADLRVIKDHLGSVRLIVNASTGAIVQRIDYNDIGGVTSDTNPGFQPYGFAGGMYDYQTGLVKFGAREYDSQAGRWTSKDPIRFNGGDTNLFGYSANDPINRFDPNGLSYVIYDRAAGNIQIFSGMGELLGSYPASNNVTKGAPAGAVPEGVFEFSHYMSHDGSASSAFGSNGNFVFNFPNGSGIGIHSGREGVCDKANRCGVDHATQGCIRSTDAATSVLKGLLTTDPLTSIIVM